MSNPPQQPVRPAEIEPVDMSDWEKRTTIDEPRLTELVELYEELGFEVRLCKIDPETLERRCSACVLAEPDRFRTIYTRRRSTEDSSHEEAP